MPLLTAPCACWQPVIIELVLPGSPLVHGRCLDCWHAEVHRGAQEDLNDAIYWGDEGRTGYVRQIRAAYISFCLQTGAEPGPLTEPRGEP